MPDFSASTRPARTVVPAPNLHFGFQVEIDAIARPVRGRQIIDAVRQTVGEFIAVSEDEIRNSLVEVCRKGYYIEPTSAATIAGIKKCLPNASQGEVMVSVFTGRGLKATEKMLNFSP